jgi:K+/H+ antiporter YhaU regulatory subunit KhtT
MGIEVIFGLIASVVTTVGGLGYFLDRNGQRIDERFASVINHMERMEVMLNDMRADLPEKYTLKSDHLRLSDKVDRIESDLTVWKHTEAKL